MSFHRLSSWFLTNQGKTFSFYAAGTAVVATMAGHFLPQTVLLDKYKDFVRLYKNGLPEPLAPHLEKRFKRALELTEIEPEYHDLYQPFFTYGFDVMSLGSSYSKYGVIVGLPFSFTYDDPEKIDKTRIKIRQESVPWGTEEAQKFLKSLIFSENAQLYAMAREIKLRNSVKPMSDMLCGAASCMVAYGLSQHINQKFDFYSKPRQLRVVLYMLVGLFVFGFYAMSKDMLQLYIEETIDKELRDKNEVFAKGGREFYSKILERNMALRKLLGREGEKLYSIHGNENFLIRNKHLPLVHRKSIFETVE
ncbi:transmembrane protein 177 [Leptinotarsa decemlineata]|uniref:transmembrane protein 177 n=1 Tax=Leptinotarsa decemlineata TaxID=7539 RepID=UPI000C252387|nr:transmembrane protein 177 [Leptinotarsa decemlineata]